MLKSNRTPSAVIYGFEGLVPTLEELDFFRDVSPMGFILFTRNIEDPIQLQQSIMLLQASVGWECPILIDQEGGRVARLKPPHWRKYPTMEVFAKQAEESLTAAAESVYANYRLLGQELHDLGINVDCAPVLDIRVDGAHDIIGDRSFGGNPEQVSVLAERAAQALLDSAVLPVIKHIPGHGRALVDSHKDLPVVDTPLELLEKTDFVPFKHLSQQHPHGWAMTAHIIYTALDKENPATQSKKVIELIRNEIGFDGFLVSDDLSMKALGGSYEDRAHRSLVAGCDAVLHCNGKMDEMKEIASAVQPLSSAAYARLERSLKLLRSPRRFDAEEAERLLKKMMA